ncbi:sortase-dependent protein [Streptomyces sp. SS7]|uniref:sortase-dependent protein n=1 Tax=Streptomyces sp. SS7 TaxID=3108485 RepID=UPI0030ECC68D
MSRTGVAALALGTAFLAGASPAFADAAPSAVPRSVATEASVVPSPAEETRDSGVGSDARDAAKAPSAAPGQVGVVPRGAADTGVAEDSEGHGTLIGGGAAAAVFAAAGAGLLVVRRRRATGA